MGKRVAIETICCLLIILFVYTALTKLITYDSFRTQLNEYTFLGKYSSLAWLLPLVELATATLLFIPHLRVKGLYVSFSLIVLFTIYLLYMIAFVPTLPCSCGGVLQSLTWVQHIFFNLFFILLSLTGIILYKRYKRNIQDSDRSPPLFINEKAAV